MNSRTLGATIGLLVSAGCIVYILTRLADAGQPAPTGLQLLNASGAPVSIDAVELGVVDGSAEPMLRGPFALAASAPPLRSKDLPLPPGRPLAVTLRGGGAVASCRLDPRPQGQCVVNAAYSGGAALQCDYDCKPLAPVR
jgi:hypothetical protein